MEVTRTGLVALVALCGAAGAGGAYLASRGSLEPAAAVVEATAQPAPPNVVDAPNLKDSLPAPPTVAPAPVSTAPIRTPRPIRRAERATDEAVRPAPLKTPSAELATSGPREPATPWDAPSPEPARPAAEAASAAPAGPLFEEVVVDRDVVLGLQFDSTVSSETARVEDQVVARVTRDVRVGDRVAIPSGARTYGEVTDVDRGGRLRERARLAVRFTSIVLADGTRLPIATDVIVREGDSPSRESAAKIGGSAIGGAILGGILGGGKGAVIGGTAGAGAGTAMVMAGGRNDAVIAAGTPVTVRLIRPVTVEVGR